LDAMMALLNGSDKRIEKRVMDLERWFETNGTMRATERQITENDREYVRLLHRRIANSDLRERSFFGRLKLLVFGR
jgi:hypothetical protein